MYHFNATTAAVQTAKVKSDYNYTFHEQILPGGEYGNERQGQPTCCHVEKFELILLTWQLQDTPLFSRKLGCEDPGNEVDAFYFTREWAGKSGRETSPNETQVTVSDEFIWCFFFQNQRNTCVDFFQ